MKINDIVTFKNQAYGVKYYVVDAINEDNENIVHLCDLKRYPGGWFKVSELEKSSEKMLRCSLDSLVKDLYNLKRVMAAAGYNPTRDGVGDAKRSRTSY